MKALDTVIYLVGPVEIGELVDEGKENVIKVADLLNEAELNGVISKDLYQSIWKRFVLMVRQMH